MRRRGHSSTALAGLLAWSAHGCEKSCPTVAAGGTVPVVPQAEAPPTAFLAVGDCSGDGRPDLIDGRRLSLARPDGSFDTSDLDVPIPPSGAAATLVDLDADGTLDLVKAGPDVEWFRGRGGCRFDPGSVLLGATQGRPVQVMAADVDLDGLTDLAISYIQRIASPVVLLTARGDGSFAEHTPAFAARPSDDPYWSGYGTYFDDVDGDGHREMFVVADFDQGWLGWGQATDDPTFVRDGAVASDFARAHAMSLCPLDYDRDGRMDYFVSGVDGNNLLLHGTGGRALASDDNAVPASAGSSYFAWGCAAFDADLDGWSDLLVLSLRGSDGGPGPANVYLNQRGASFGCVSSGLLDATLGAHGLVCADFAGRGQPSCLAGDGMTQGLVRLDDDLTPHGGWVGVRLRGTVSSPDADGARVSLDGATPPLVVMAGGQSPYGGEHDRAVVLAVGARATADVTITWPSGLRQTARGLAAGSYADVTEPAALRVARRFAPADGATLVEVIVDPAVAGARSATVDCVGACDWSAPAMTDDQGRLHRSLRAPAMPGSARVTAALDGAPLRVRPRIRFGP